MNGSIEGEGSIESEGKHAAIRSLDEHELLRFIVGYIANGSPIRFQPRMSHTVYTNGPVNEALLPKNAKRLRKRPAQSEGDASD